jgi:diguanylate cyclase (GGDEF)-like protein
LRFENEMLVGDLQRLLSKVAESNKELDRLATTDEMTGASNFRAFRVELEKQYRRHMLSRKMMALAILNLDDFYAYNHYYGQDMGNRTITRIVHLLMSELAQSDALVARINGAEFAVIMSDATPQSARLLLDTVVHKLQGMQIEHCRSGSSDVVTLSGGVYCALASEEVAPREMIQRAEQALHQARKKGAGRIEIVEG